MKPFVLGWFAISAIVVGIAFGEDIEEALEEGKGIIMVTKNSEDVIFAKLVDVTDEHYTVRVGRGFFKEVVPHTTKDNLRLRKVQEDKARRLKKVVRDLAAWKARAEGLEKEIRTLKIVHQRKYKEWDAHCRSLITQIQKAKQRR